MSVQNASERLYDMVRAEILRGELKPGTHLTEAWLADRFQVSRTPVREAISRLEAVGLTERKRNCGSVVARVDLSRIWEIQVVRMNLEGLAAALAAGKIVDNDIDFLQSCIDAMDKALDEENEEDFGENHEQFHRAIFQIGGNNFLMECIQNMLDMASNASITRWKSLYSKASHTMDQTMRGHRLMLQSLRQHDAAGARIAAEEHILNALLRFQAKLDGQIPADMIMR